MCLYCRRLYAGTNSFQRNIQNLPDVSVYMFHMKMKVIHTYSVQMSLSNLFEFGAFYRSCQLCFLSRHWEPLFSTSFVCRFQGKFDFHLVSVNSSYPVFRACTTFVQLGFKKIFPTVELSRLGFVVQNCDPIVAGILYAPGSFPVRTSCKENEGFGFKISIS